MWITGELSRGRGKIICKILYAVRWPVWLEKHEGKPIWDESTEVLRDWAHRTLQVGGGLRYSLCLVWEATVSSEQRKDMIWLRFSSVVVFKSKWNGSRENKFLCDHIFEGSVVMKMTRILWVTCIHKRTWGCKSCDGFWLWILCPSLVHTRPSIMLVELSQCLSLYFNNRTASTSQVNSSLAPSQILLCT